MGLKVYLPIALVVFLAGTTGADLVARTSIAREPFAAALREHLYYYGNVQRVGTIVLLVPFVAVALLSARAGKRARTRGVAWIFAAAMLTLLYFYYQGHQAAQLALLEHKWTASALAVGFLPFFPGVPVVLAVLAAGAFAAKVDPLATDQERQRD
jgi:hypothetical protein